MESSLTPVYKKYEELTVETENKLKDFLLKMYDKAKTIDINGIKSISQKGNQGLRRKMDSGVRQIMSRYQAKIESSSYAKKTMGDAAKAGVKAVREMGTAEKQALSLAETIVNEGQFQSFLRGHISNMQGIVFNEGRRIRERIDENFSGETSLTIVKNQVGKMKFNRNILRLSVVSHPRALFRNIIARDAEIKGQKNFKVIAPKSIIPTLAVAGITATYLYTIATEQEWNKRADNKSNANAVGGLGLHHGSREYYYPVDEEMIDEEKELARQQRSEYLASLAEKKDGDKKTA